MEVCTAYQNITLAQLQTLLSARFDSQVFWTAEEQTFVLNEGLSLMQIATGRWRNRYNVTTVAGRCFYSIPVLPQLQVGGICQVVQAIRVCFNGSPPLDWSSFTDIDALVPGWQAQTTATAGCPPVPAMAGPAGVNYLWIWPADAAGNNDLQIDFILNAPKLVNPGDYVNLDSTEIVGLLDFGQHLLSEKRGGVFFQRTFPLYVGFLKMLADRNSYLVNISAFRSVVGTDFARNYSPRRKREQTGIGVGLGVR